MVRMTFGVWPELHCPFLGITCDEWWVDNPVFYRSSYGLCSSLRSVSVCAVVIVNWICECCMVIRAICRLVWRICWRKYLLFDVYWQLFVNRSVEWITVISFSSRFVIWIIEIMSKSNKNLPKRKWIQLNIESVLGQSFQIFAAPYERVFNLKERIEYSKGKTSNIL